MTQQESRKQILSEWSAVRVFAPGRARTKGSMKPTHVRLGGGKCRVGLREDGEYSAAWKGRMIAAIRRQCEVQAWPGPVRVFAEFIFWREGFAADECGWPVAHEYGDEDKLRRNLLDALTQSGLLADDALVIGGTNVKRFAGEGEDAGVRFSVTVEKASGV
jgi:Holliday junction resolvase RusA-like endonuclease